MSLRITPAMVARKPGHQGELEVSRKTIVQGMPGRFRRTCGDYRVLTTFCTRTAGATGTRHSLRPLSSRDSVEAAARARLRRGKANSYPVVVARLDRAIQYSEAPAMKSRTRGVLDTPHARAMTLYLLFEN
jgi:hypothetical protein